MNLGCFVRNVNFTAEIKRNYFILQISVRERILAFVVGCTVARMEEGRGVYRVLVGKPERKRPTGRPRRRWEDNISMDLQEVGCGGMDWIELAEDRNR
jgi:hypothetical protein